MDDYPYQKAIDYLNERGIKATPSKPAYKLLHRLAILHGIDMNGSKGNICREFGYSKNKVIALAKDALSYFCNTDKLIVPKEFLFRKKKVYLHDGDATANRNLWRQSNKARSDKKRKKPVEYSLNTIDK